MNYICASGPPSELCAIGNESSGVHIMYMTIEPGTSLIIKQNHTVPTPTQIAQDSIDGLRVISLEFDTPFSRSIAEVGIVSDADDGVESITSDSGAP